MSQKVFYSTISNLVIVTKSNATSIDRQDRWSRIDQLYRIVFTLLQKEQHREEEETEIENAGADGRAKKREGRREGLGCGHVSQRRERYRFQNEGRYGLTRRWKRRRESRDSCFAKISRKIWGDTNLIATVASN